MPGKDLSSLYIMTHCMFQSLLCCSLAHDPSSERVHVAWLSNRKKEFMVYSYFRPHSKQNKINIRIKRLRFLVKKYKFSKRLQKLSFYIRIAACVDSMARKVLRQQQSLLPRHDWLKPRFICVNRSYYPINENDRIEKDGHVTFTHNS